MEKMYSGMVNSPPTELANAITATATTIAVVDGAKLPAPPNLAMIGSYTDTETILYTSKSGNNLSGVTRGFQGVAQVWNAGEVVTRNFAEYDYSTIIKNITNASPFEFTTTIPASAWNEQLSGEYITNVTWAGITSTSSAFIAFPTLEDAEMFGGLGIFKGVTANGYLTLYASEQALTDTEIKLTFEIRGS